MTFEEFITTIKKLDSRFANCSWSYGDSEIYTATGAGVNITWDKYFTVTFAGSASIGRGDTIEDAFLNWEYSESLN